MSIVIGAAERDDVPALVRLRLANAARHLDLDPGVHRMPDVEAVRGYFEGVLAHGSTVVILVAEAAGEAVGMVEVVLPAEPLTIRSWCRAARPRSTPWGWTGIAARGGVCPGGGGRAGSRGSRGDGPPCRHPRAEPGGGPLLLLVGFGPRGTPLSKVHDAGGS
ncbi:hypothetical protein GCM10025734_07960 [Kitasatospora paranensis]